MSSWAKPETVLREVLSYDPLTGDFTWLVTSGRAQAGSRAGCVDRDGHVRIRFAGKRYFAHRLAWWFQTGEWPEFDIDHKNVDPADNRFDNLRPATTAQNAANRSAKRALPKGVVARTGGRFQAQIGVGGKTIYLGRFGSVAEASAAYEAAARQAFGEFARAS